MAKPADNTATNPSAKPEKKPDKPLLKIEDVPKEIRDFAVNKISPKDDLGNPRKDGKGKDIVASITTAKEGGSYYGQVVLNNEKFLVQVVGKDKNFAIVHPKDKIELQGANLNKLDAEKRLNNQSIQIHYKGDKAKAYSWAVNKEKTNELTPEKFIEQARQYAQNNIKNAGQRTTFINHLEKASGITIAARETNKPEPEKLSAPKEKAKTKSQDLER